MVPRSDPLPWPSVVGLMLAAVVLNGVGIYGSGVVLALVLNPQSPEPRERVTDFELVDGNALVDEAGVIPDHAGQGSEPSPELARVAGSAPSPLADQTELALGRGGLAESVGRAGEQDGEGRGPELGSGDASLVEAEDGEVARDGAAPGAAMGEVNPLAQLGGSPAMLEDAFGPLRPAEAPREVESGVETILDDERQIYASFMSRMSKQLLENFHPNEVMRDVDPDGARYGTRTTKLQVRLDEDGAILKIVLLEESGVDDLDAEAVRAVRAAAPFPNPPRALFGARGYFGPVFHFTRSADGGRDVRHRQ